MSTHAPCLTPVKSALDVSTALVRLNGNLPLYRKLLMIFRGRYQGQSLEVDRLTSESGRADARIFVHSMKGAAGNIAALDVESEAALLEEHLAEGRIDLEFVRLSVSRLNAGILEALVEIEHFLGSME